MNLHKKKPALIRPQLSREVGDRLWSYCNDNNLIASAVADLAIREWLDRHQSQPPNSVSDLAIAS